MIIFSEEIKKFRVENKWSMVTMAEFLYKVSYPTYVRWENGKNPDRWVQCLVLEKLLGHPVNMNDIPEMKGRGPNEK